ncbi:hypothetical protein FB451DRAFT_1172952 [Mycena latifolia]|nr:hypothetical protein FB451DRAFT_1172952 [Mycena latifolia]
MHAPPCRRRRHEACTTLIQHPQRLPGDDYQPSGSASSPVQMDSGRGKFATLIARNSPLPVRNTRRLTLHGRTIRVFAGMAEFTNATEFLGSIVLPHQMPTSRLKITIDLNIFDMIKGARMEAEAAALAEREDVKRRMQALRTYLTQSQPILRRNLSKLARDDPQRALRAQIAEAVDVLDV